MTLSIPTMWLLPDLYLMLCHNQAISILSKPRTLIPVFSKISTQTWWANRAYQVMLTFHNRLITPHLIWVHVCLSELSLCCLCVYRLMIFRKTLRISGIRIWYVGLRLIEKPFDFSSLNFWDLLFLFMWWLCFELWCD